MKKYILALAACAMTTMAQAQFGFGGEQKQVEETFYSERITDINYAGDSLPSHNLDIYLPETKADSYPVVIHIYGSAWFSNSSKGFADIATICRAYLKAGYAVVCPNHRASTEAKWPAQCHDIKAVIRFVRANAEAYHFDPTFIALSGFSSGGHLSALMASTSGSKTAKVGNFEIDLEGNVGPWCNESSHINAAISWSGPLDMEAMDCANRPNGVSGSPEEVLVGVAFSDETQDRYRSVSTTSYMDAGDPPLLGFHGTADNVVPYCQAEVWDKAYTASGVRHELVTVKDGGHGFNMYSEENLARAVSFLNQERKF